MAKTAIKNWSKEAVTALIEVYKNNPCLYNVKSVEYHNRERARDALAEMVKVVAKYHSTVTEEDCKRKYQSLRNQFCKEHGKVVATKGKSGSGITDLYEPKLWCYDQLVFLKESIYQKRGTYIGNTNKKDEDSELFSGEEYEEEMTVEYLEEAVEDWATSQAENIINTPKTTNKRKLEETFSNPLRKQCLIASRAKSMSPLPGSSRGTTPEAESLNSTIEMYIQKKTEQRTQKLQKDKYTAFGDYVGSWLREQKNKNTRKQCMCEIMNTIAKYEIEDSD